MFRPFWVLIVCAALISCTTSQPRTENAEMEVQQASDRFWATRERGDASGLATQFTETAIFMVPGLPDAEGRGAIRESLQQRFASLRAADLDVHRREIEVIGDSAYELGWFSEVSHPQRGDSMRMDGRYLIVWKREPDGIWRAHRNLFNFSAATPVEPPAN